MRPSNCNAAGSSRKFSFYGRFTSSNAAAATLKAPIHAPAREQKIVFIGVRLDATGIKRVLDECLVSEEEATMQAQDWAKWASLWDTLL